MWHGIPNIILLYSKSEAYAYVILTIGRFTSYLIEALFFLFSFFFVLSMQLLCHIHFYIVTSYNGTKCTNVYPERKCASFKDSAP